MLFNEHRKTYIFSIFGCNKTDGKPSPISLEMTISTSYFYILGHYCDTIHYCKPSAVFRGKILCLIKCPLDTASLYQSNLPSAVSFADKAEVTRISTAACANFLGTVCDASQAIRCGLD